MQFLTVTGTRDVAALLRNLADEVTCGSGAVGNGTVHFSESLSAEVELIDATEMDVSRIEIRLEHTAPTAWSLTRLQATLAHPGD